MLGMLIFFGSAKAQQESEKSFSLQECINYALAHNKEVINANLDREIAEAAVREILSDGLPQINATLDLAYNYKVPTTQLPAILIPDEFREPGTPSTGFVPVNFSTAYNGNAAISVEQMIFNGSYFVGLQAAKSYTDLSEKKHIKSKIDVIEAVSKAYYTVLVNQERIALVNKNFDRLDSLLANTKAMYENGFAEKIDVSRIQVQFNNIKVEKKNIEKVVALSKALLQYQMGMPSQAEELELADKLEDVDFKEIRSDLGNEFQYSDRIEYSQLKVNRDLLDLDIKNTRVQYLPKISFYGSLGANAGTENSDDLLSFRKDPWFGLGLVGLRVNLPIFDGFRKSNIIQQKKVQVEQIDNNFEQLKSNIDLEIREARVSYETAIDNMAAQEENMKLADEVYNVSRIKYEEGVGSNIEVLEADADYKQAQINYYNALFDALIAKVTLEKAYGELLQED